MLSSEAVEDWVGTLDEETYRRWQRLIRWPATWRARHWRLQRRRWAQLRPQQKKSAQELTELKRQEVVPQKQAEQQGALKL